MVFVLIIIIIAMLSAFVYRNYINPAFIMSTMWALITAICLSDIMPYYSISDGTYLVIAIGITAFFFGCLTGANVKFIHGTASSYAATEAPTYALNYTWVIILQLAAALLMLPEVINTIELLSSGEELSAIRENATQGMSVIDSQILQLIRNYITNPFLVIVYPLTAYSFFMTKGKTRTTIVALTVVLCAEQILYQGGRVPLVYFIMHFLLMMAMLKKKIHISKKVKRNLLIIAIVAVVAFYYLSISRGIKKGSFAESIILYISGCVPLLDQKLSGITANGVYSYGGAFCLGLLRLVFTLLENIGLPYPAFLSLIEKLTNAEQTVLIGEDTRMNAFVSLFFYFFLDGGYVAVILESFIYGWFAHAMYRNMKQGYNPKYMILYAVVVQSLIFSMVRFQFILPNFIIAILLVQLLFKRKRNENISCNTVR